MEMKGLMPRERTQQAFALREFKALDDNAGLFEGYLAVFGNLDQNGDVIDRGAFTKTLREASEVKTRTSSAYLFPILWQHDSKNPIGGFTDAHEDERGLFVRGQYDMDIPEGKRAYSGSKKGYLRGLSIGYDTIKSVFDTKRDRHLLEIRLWEGSPVTFPANTEAQITQVKSASGSLDWPIADRDHPWDAGEANQRLQDWAKSGDSIDMQKWASVHFYKPEGDDAKNISAYKFPFCDVVNGSVHAIINAVANGKARLSGASIPPADKTAILSKMNHYLDKAGANGDEGSGSGSGSGGKGRQFEVAKAAQSLGGLQALMECAAYLDNSCDSAEAVVESLANACGLSMKSLNDAALTRQPQVAALLAGIDDLEPSIKGVIMAYQEYRDQTDALLGVLGIPDLEVGLKEEHSDRTVASLRSAFDLKAGRQLSSGNRAKLVKIASGLSNHVEEIKALLNDNDKIDENAQDIDIDQEIAAGRKKDAEAKPGDTTSTLEPDDEKSTLEALEYTLWMQSLEI